MKPEHIINKAIEEADLIYLDGTLVKPYTFNGEELSYLNFSDMENYVNVLDNIEEVKAYEEGGN